MLSLDANGRAAPVRRSGAVLKPLFAFTQVALAPRRHGSFDAAARERRLLEAEAWLCRAQDASSDGGVSYGYSLRGGWRPSYPETSGYIATTFLRLARERDPSYAERARRILQWLLRVQNADGSFCNPRYGRDGIVFDTGQVLFGLVHGHEASGDAALLDAARRAAAWLVGIADADGRWTRHEHLGTPHVYNTRSAWALLRLNQVEPDPAREAVARRNLDWALAEQQPSGFFEHCSFQEGEAPFTHTIAYTARGLLESGLLLGEPRYLDAAERCARATLHHLRDDGHLPSTITPGGTARAKSVCLTGNCQFAIVWSRLDKTRPDRAFRDGAVRALDYVMSTQDVVTANPDLRGGIRGSEPVWGRYAPMSYPNWATKFFIDAMWLRRRFAA